MNKKLIEGNVYILKCGGSTWVESTVCGFQNMPQNILQDVKQI